MVGTFIKYALVSALLSAMAFESNGQYFSNYDPNEELFVREVKLIDEFIARFNDNDSAFVRKMSARDKQYKFSRGRLLVSLFNLENTAFTDNDTTLKGFFRQILDKQHPVFISFTDSDWYADAQAVFSYAGKLVEIPVVLHVKSQGDEWSKWMITGVGSMKAANEPTPSVSVKKVTGKSPQYISTSAYATNFVELHYILSENMEPEYFFEPQLSGSDRGRQFVQEIKSGQLKFQYVKKITFHFYQVNGWVFTVDQFNRKASNSGWLISSIQKVSAQEKVAARKKLLNR